MEAAVKSSPTERLAAVKARLAAARERNVAEVDRESQRAVGVGPGEEEARLELREKRAAVRKSKKDRRGNAFGVDGAWEAESAVVTEEKTEKRRDKKSAMSGATGAAVFSEEALAAAHEKRIRAMEVGLSKGKPSWADRVHFPGNRRQNSDLDEMDYGGTKNDSAQAVDRVVGELAQVQERRDKFKRRRAFHEDREDIHFINERNRKFNQKISRAFDKHTEEIKQNLERGTALP